MKPCNKKSSFKLRTWGELKQGARCFLLANIHRRKGKSDTTLLKCCEPGFFFDWAIKGAAKLSSQHSRTWKSDAQKTEAKDSSSEKSKQTIVKKELHCSFSSTTSASEIVQLSSSAQMMFCEHRCLEQFSRSL